MPRRSAADLMTPRLVSPPPVPVELPAPPTHLSAVMKAWWHAVLTEYELGPHHLKLLEAAADAWDRAVEARAQVLDEGLTVTGPHGVKTHPAVAVERDSKTLFARLVRELDLDTPPPPESAWRPPALRSNRRRT